MKTKAQISFAVTAKLISAFVFAKWIVQFLYFLNPKFPASSHPLCLYRLVWVRPGGKPHCVVAHCKDFIENKLLFFFQKKVKKESEEKMDVDKSGSSSEDKPLKPKADKVC